MEGWMHLYFAGIRVLKLARPLRGQDTQRVAKMSHEQISLTFHGCFCFFSRTPHNLDLLQMLGKEWTKHIFHTWWCVSWWWIPWYQMKSNLNKSKEIETSIARISYIHQGLGIHLLSIMNSKHIVKLKRQGWEIKSWEIENILWTSKEDVEKLKKFPLLFLKTQELPLEKPPTWKPLRGENAQCELGNWLVCFWGSMLPWKSARHHSKECWVKFWVIII